MITGSSKVMPKAMMRLMHRLKYSFMEGKASMRSVVKLKKNLNAKGKATKKAKDAPRIKKMHAAITKGTT